MLKVGSCFTGIGAWEKALIRLGIEFELMFFSEIDKYAIKSYCAIHNESESKNLGDITKVDVEKVPDIDLFVYSPPCQAFSVAGRQEGFNDKRGILFFDSLKIIEAKRPKICCMENVKGLTTKKFKNEFASMLESLEELGYNNYYQVLNAKKYGIPQNRERVFIISIRKDSDDCKFQFPKPFDNGLRLKDFLETDVNEKYYISQDKADKLIATLKGKIVTGQYNQKNGFKANDFACVIDASVYKGLGNNQNRNAVAVQRIGNVNPSNKGMNSNVFDSEGLCPTITTRQPKVLEPQVLRYERTEHGKQIRKQYESKEIEEKIGNMRELQPRTDGISNTITTVLKDNILIEPVICASRGRYKDDGSTEQKLEINDSGQSNTLTSVEKDNYVLEISFENMCIDDRDKGYGVKTSEIIPTQRASRSGLKVCQDYKIRKLTPKECWRLMGFNDEDIDKCIEVGISNSQLYKQAGNSIVVNVLEEIFKKLFKNI